MHAPPVTPAAFNSSPSVLLHENASILLGPTRGDFLEQNPPFYQPSTYLVGEPSSPVASTLVRPSMTQPFSEPSNSVTPPESPRNSVGCDIESLLRNPNFDLAALTVFDRPPKDPESHEANSKKGNVTIRKKAKSSKNLGKGKYKSIALFTEGEDNLSDIPISVGEVNLDVTRALRASHPDMGAP